MAQILSILAFQFIFLYFLSSFLTPSVLGTISKPSIPKKFHMRKEKLTHFRVYWQDILSGQNPSSVNIIPSVSNSSTLFGSVQMIDNPLTLAPALNSTLIGRAQGFYASASQQDIGLLMAMNFVFVQGKYKNSTLTVLGQNAVLSEVREFPIVGGSGLFRFARGYVKAKSYKIDFKSGDATIEYNCYVLHY